MQNSQKAQVKHFHQNHQLLCSQYDDANIYLVIIFYLFYLHTQDSSESAPGACVFLPCGQGQQESAAFASI